MSKITNVRLPDTSSTAVYDPQKFNQLVRSLEQIILQLNTTYTPITSENTLGALSWFEANGGQCEMNSGSSTPVFTYTFGEANSFDQSNKPVPESVWKPAIRVKEVVDRIFAKTGYGVESEFFGI